MQQQINLYSYFPLPPKQYVTLKTIIFVSIGFALLLLLNSVYSYQQLNKSAKHLAQLSIMQQSAAAHLASVTRQYPLLNDASQLEKKLQELRQELTIKSQVFVQIAPGIKFSDYLTGLAEIHVAGVWITSFQIAEGGRKITLKGQAQDISLIHAYLKQLSKQAAFHNEPFEFQEVIGEKAKDSSIIAFSLNATQL